MIFSLIFIDFQLSFGADDRLMFLPKKSLSPTSLSSIRTLPNPVFQKDNNKLTRHHVNMQLQKCTILYHVVFYRVALKETKTFFCVWKCRKHIHNSCVSIFRMMTIQIEKKLLLYSLVDDSIIRNWRFFLRKSIIFKCNFVFTKYVIQYINPSLFSKFV